MKIYLICFSTLLLRCSAPEKAIIYTSRAAVPPYMFINIKQIIVGDKAGTCFIISYKAHNYVVTSRHILNKLYKNGEYVPAYILEGETAIKILERIYLYDNESIDIAVFEADGLIKEPIDVTPFDTLYHIGEECIFFGYPFNYYTSHQFDNYPLLHLPLIKHGIISGIVEINGVNYLVIDGMNNEGFSGGPVYTYNYIEKMWKLVGVISAYTQEIHKTSNDTINYFSNSGLAEAISSSLVFKLIDKNIK